LIPKLSSDPVQQVPNKLQEIAEFIHAGNTPNIADYYEFPAIQFAVESALRDVAHAELNAPFPGKFEQGKNIPINGLIWMGDKAFMTQQIKEKIAQGFNCIKLKIGAIDFDTELQILKGIREEFSASDMEIRVDANGAFSPEEALHKLEQLATFELHSIEQPIKQGQWAEMARLCHESPLPIALDEELIGIHDTANKIEVLSFIQPQYIILKPSLIGGFTHSDEWITLAEQHGIGWWATSALESNIGLNAIAQWVSHKNTQMPQGLGTGGLFTNNINAPLVVEKGYLTYDANGTWQSV
jgi:o-succinylbenzoate synthase